MDCKDRIVKIFYQNVKGKIPDVCEANPRHDGKYGHWLERQFGIVANSNNKSDLWGYELKNQTNSKTTFGDWSANEYVFTDARYSELFKGSTKAEKQNGFVRIFGKSNQNKNGRYSWSGKACPKVSEYNDFGQILIIEQNKDIIACYSYSKDQREDKSIIVPKKLQQENLIVARWYGEHSPSTKKTDKCLKEKLENKFNNRGWFTCKMNSEGEYCKICFGKNIDYETWLNLVKGGTVFLDSGMHEGNARPYSQWRAKNDFWDNLIYLIYE